MQRRQRELIEWGIKIKISDERMILTTGMRDLSGDGLTMAHHAGASLGNMEFITFCCDVFYSPPRWRGSLDPGRLPDRETSG